MPKLKNGDRPATKGDLLHLRSELKSDIQRLDDKIDRVALSLVNTQADFREMKQTMATKKDIELVLGAIDAKALSHGQILQEHEARLKDHQTRLVALEA